MAGLFTFRLQQFVNLPLLVLRIVLRKQRGPADVDGGEQRVECNQRHEGIHPAQRLERRRIKENEHDDTEHRIDEEHPLKHRRERERLGHADQDGADDGAQQGFLHEAAIRTRHATVPAASNGRD